ncbi:unnamed protein product [Kluyveromyces dobzhanskii CBS 2104]|uniref:Origin recognition complex subunit 2 n=1 Tax=Kluyveromyces dobzhanskii CBS 2104 TaxID=1427455 RepID=A0A0A8LBF4_9SACH|nr:unnamed protein product [Kluyveromyces dobzhanskii CBS 2104]
MTKNDQDDSNDSDVDIVNHQDIFVSPGKVRQQSPKRLESVNLQSPSKSSRIRSPRRSQVLESIDVERSSKEEVNDNWIPEDVGSPRRKGSRSTKKVKVEEENFVDNVSVSLGSNDKIVDDQEFKIESVERSPSKSPRRKLVFSSDPSPKRKTARDIVQRNKLLEDDLESEDIQQYKLLKLNLNPKFRPTTLPKDSKYDQTSEEQTQIYFFDGFEGFIDQTKILKTDKRSKNSMSSAPNITRDEYNILSQLTNDIFHRSSTKAVQKIHETLFQQFTFELLQGFTLLFYGIGSKKKFLESFAFNFLSMKIALLQNPDIQTNAPCVPVFVINGYTTISKNVFLDIFKILMEGETIEDQAQSNYWDNRIDLQMDRLLKYFKKRPPTVKMILIVHNLDGPSFRREHFQTRMSILAQIKQICVIASADHIQAPLLWDHFRAQSFNFVYHDITNFEPYIVETVHTDNAIDISKGSGTLFNANAAKYVLESLTDNSKRMYKILLESLLAQINAKNEPKPRSKATTTGKTTAGIEFADLFKTCTEQFVISNEMGLRTILSEFIDHKMAVSTKNKMGKEIINVKYSYGDMEKMIVEIESMLQ